MKYGQVFPGGGEGDLWKEGTRDIEDGCWVQVFQPGE